MKAGSWVSETIVSGFELETRVLLKYVPYSAAFEEGKRPAAGARGATHRVAFFSEKSNGNWSREDVTFQKQSDVAITR